MKRIKQGIYGKLSLSEWNVNIPVPQWGKKVWITLAAIVMVASLFIAYANDPSVVNFSITAVVAHYKAGEDIPFQVDDIDYTGTSPVYYWSTEGNSMYLIKEIYHIVPYMEYEGLTVRGSYPVIALFVPFGNSDYFHILGRWIPAKGIVAINERYLAQADYVPNQAQFLATLVHELVHVQGGGYISGKSSTEYEARTEAGSIEVLAAMCNHSHEVACQAFWKEVEGYAMAQLEVQAPAWWYEFIRSWVSSTPDAWRDKSIRHWADKQEQLHYIIDAYTIRPWQQLIIPAAKGTQKFDTGMFYNVDHKGRMINLVTDFDDVAYLLGWLLNLIY